MKDEFKPPFLWLDGLFVKAPMEKVLPRFRGEMAAVTSKEGIENYEVTGRSTHIELILGPDATGSMTDERHKVSLGTFRVRGFARVSTVRCHPEWTFVEADHSYSPIYFFLQNWLAEPQIAIWSKTVGSPIIDAEDSGFAAHGFRFYEDGKEIRDVSYTKNFDGTNFYKRGLMQSFENPAHFKSRRREDKMNRAVLYEILENLDIDPVSVFEKRELDNAHLYTCDHEGQSCAIYEDDRLHYIRSRE